MKGLFRWTYLPLSFYSVLFLLTAIKATVLNISGLISSIVILAACIVFPIGQLIAYKCIQEPEDEKIWVKWIEFAGYVRLILVAVLLAFYVSYANQIPLYFIYPVFVAYDVLFVLKEDFDFVMLGRTIYLFGEAIILAIFSLFIWGGNYVAQYDLDVYLISAVLLIDLIYYIARTVKAIRNQKSDSINPGNPE